MEQWEMEKAEMTKEIEFLRNAMANLAKQSEERDREVKRLKEENKRLKEESKQVAQENIHANIDIDALEDKLDAAKTFVSKLAQSFLEMYIDDI